MIIIIINNIHYWSWSSIINIIYHDDDDDDDDDDVDDHHHHHHHHRQHASFTIHSSSSSLLTSFTMIIIIIINNIIIDSRCDIILRLTPTQFSVTCLVMNWSSSPNFLCFVFTGDYIIRFFFGTLISYLAPYINQPVKKKVTTVLRAAPVITWVALNLNEVETRFSCRLDYHCIQHILSHLVLSPWWTAQDLYSIQRCLEHVCSLEHVPPQKDFTCHFGIHSSTWMCRLDMSPSLNLWKLNGWLRRNAKAACNFHKQTNSMSILHRYDQWVLHIFGIS